MSRAGEGVGEGGASEFGNSRDGFFAGVEFKAKFENRPLTSDESDVVVEATSEPW